MSSDLTPQRGTRTPLSRSQREDHAYRLVVIGGVAAAVTAVTALLAILGVIGWGLAIAGAAVAAFCALRFRRLLRRTR